MGLKPEEHRGSERKQDQVLAAVHTGAQTRVLGPKRIAEGRELWWGAEEDLEEAAPNLFFAFLDTTSTLSSTFTIS